MKIFISADIEGSTTTTTWDETNDQKSAYALHAKQMTNEVLACIEGAQRAGAVTFTVRDAHAWGNNIDPTKMPHFVTLLRGWSGHPYSMADGVDKMQTAAMFIGYHSAAGKEGNPLAHTMTSSKFHTIKLNGELASEFMLYSYAAALEGVPTVFLSGDNALCRDSLSLHPKLITCPVKDAVGRMTINYSTKDTIEDIIDLAEKALSQDLSDALVELPRNFHLEIDYKTTGFAEKASWFPGVKKTGATTVEFETETYFEVLRAVSWLSMV